MYLSVHITQLIAGRTVTDVCQKPLTSELLWSFFGLLNFVIFICWFKSNYLDYQS